VSRRIRDLAADHPDFFSLVPVWSTKQLAPAQIFDDVVMAATEGCSCFVVNTGEGLLLFDALLPCRACFENIAAAIEGAGWRLSDLRRILITHGHYDHTGAAGRLAHETGAEIWFPAGEYARWRSEFEVKRTNGNILRAGSDLLPVSPDIAPARLLRDGDAFTLGHTSVRCVHTPGHTPDCMSYVFNVTDSGTSHLALMPGGTLPQPMPGALAAQLDSLALCDRLVDELGIDVELQNHHPLCCGEAKMALCRSRLSHIANPFVIGTDGVHAAIGAYRRLCEAKREAIRKDLAEAGTKVPD